MGQFPATIDETMVSLRAYRTTPICFDHACQVAFRSGLRHESNLPAVNAALGRPHWVISIPSFLRCFVPFNILFPNFSLSSRDINIAHPSICTGTVLQDVHPSQCIFRPQRFPCTRLQTSSTSPKLSVARSSKSINAPCVPSIPAQPASGWAAHEGNSHPSP